jgi:hypothetical protein
MMRCIVYDEVKPFAGGCCRAAAGVGRSADRVFIFAYTVSSSKNNSHFWSNLNARAGARVASFPRACNFDQKKLYFYPRQQSILASKFVCRYRQLALLYSVPRTLLVLLYTPAPPCVRVMCQVRACSYGGRSGRVFGTLRYPHLILPYLAYCGQLASHYGGPWCSPIP